MDALVADLEASLPNVWGRRAAHDLHRRRHAEPLLARVDRSPADRGAHAPPGRSRCRDHDGGESRARSRSERFRGYRAAGVNRLSIGVQSFDDARLAAIGRVHGADEARRALAAALEIFPTVNVDLMYALPGQALERALADVREAIALGAPHVSAYHLTLEPDTHFHRFPPELPDDDVAADMQEAIEARARRRGLRALRDLGVREARPPRAAQPQLLDLRRLPRHRRRRARQDLVPRPHRARGARAQAASLPARGARGQRACTRRARWPTPSCRSSSC